VIDMNGMFRNYTSVNSIFNQDIGSWDVEQCDSYTERYVW